MLADARPLRLQLTLFTRGKTAIASQIPDDTPASFAAFKASIRHVAGDRSDGPGMAAALAGRSFDAVFDLNGREAADTATALAALGGASAVGQYVYCSSAGVYLKSDLMPHRETDPGDPKSRHKGKLDTEALLGATPGLNWTSVRPVYIYGPLNVRPARRAWRRAGAQETRRGGPQRSSHTHTLTQPLTWPSLPSLLPPPASVQPGGGVVLPPPGRGPAGAGAGLRAGRDPAGARG